MRCSCDLRKRVIEFVRSGGSKADAAQLYQVSRASVYNWLKDDDVSIYHRPGPKGSRKIDLEVLAAHVEEHDDLTQAERARHFGVSRHCMWYSLRRIKIGRILDPIRSSVLRTRQKKKKKGGSCPRDE